MEPRTGDLGMADWRRQILERFLLLDYVTKEFDLWVQLDFGAALLPHFQVMTTRNRLQTLPRTCPIGRQITN